MEEEKMLYPRENRVRGVIDLGGVWNFKLGDEKEPGDSFVMGEDTELMAVIRRTTRNTGTITAGRITSGRLRFRPI